MLRSLSAKAALASLALGCGIPLCASGCNLIFDIEAADTPAIEGQGGSAGGAAGGPQGGSAGSPGPAGSAGSAGSSDDPKVPIPSPTGLLGHPCPTPQERACDRPADKMIVQCAGTPPRWGPLQLCEGTDLCDGNQAAGDRYATCQPVAEVCLGQRPGDVVCEGEIRHICGPDLVTTESTLCKSAQHCLLGGETGCAPCLPGDFACEGATLKTCAEDGLSFVSVTQCETVELCNPGAGACTTAACSTGQYRCNSNNLETCNAGNTAFDLVEACGSKICDAQGKQCDLCAPGSAKCIDGTTRGVCDPAGQAFNPSTCAAPTPHCAGQGQCVACTADAHCPIPPLSSCQVRACSGGQCGTAAAPDGTSCGGGKVCEFGTCVCPFKAGGVTPICQPCNLVLLPDGTSICEPV